MQNARDMVERGRQVRGEAQWQAKLNAKLVTEIRDRHARGASVAALARELGVHKNTIDKVVRFETWKHVPDLGCDPHEFE